MQLAREAKSHVMKGEQDEKGDFLVNLVNYDVVLMFSI